MPWVDRIEAEHANSIAQASVTDAIAILQPRLAQPRLISTRGASRLCAHGSGYSCVHREASAPECYTYRTLSGRESEHGAGADAPTPSQTLSHSRYHTQIVRDAPRFLHYD